ncbi:hypothetical protein T492DRAFT_1013074 [Pavlovales sp. CCMP2436]|nr:hypothetical protein T492DRAFT_1013074 [Pavlovales sp. CCMP2436]
MYVLLIGMSALNAVLLLGCAMDWHFGRSRRVEGNERSRLGKVSRGQTEGSVEESGAGGKKLAQLARADAEEEKAILAILEQLAPVHLQQSGQASGACGDLKRSGQAPSAGVLSAALARSGQSGNDHLGLYVKFAARKEAHTAVAHRRSLEKGRRKSRVFEGAVSTALESESSVSTAAVTAQVAAAWRLKMRNEHTVLALFLSSKRTFSRAQLVQIFFNVLALELVAECVLFSADAPDASDASPWPVTSLYTAAVCLPGLLLFKSIWWLRDWPLVARFVREPSALEKKLAAVLLQSRSRSAAALRKVKTRRCLVRIGPYLASAATIVLQTAVRRRLARRRANSLRGLPESLPDLQAAAELAQDFVAPTPSPAARLGAQHAQRTQSQPPVWRAPPAPPSLRHQPAPTPFATPLSGLRPSDWNRIGSPAQLTARQEPLSSLDPLHRLRAPHRDGLSGPRPSGRKSALLAARLSCLDSLHRPPAPRHDGHANVAAYRPLAEGGYGAESMTPAAAAPAGAPRTQQLDCSFSRGARLHACPARVLRRQQLGSLAHVLRRRRLCRLPAAWFDALAWVLMLLAYALCVCVCLVYSGMFGRDNTTSLLLSWSGAMGQTFLLQEPCWVLIVVGLPYGMRQMAAVPCLGVLLGRLEAAGFEMG